MQFFSNTKRSIFARSHHCAGILLILLLAQSLLAQTNTIQGVVADPSKASIPGATVTIRNLETGVARSITTNAVGYYSVPLLNAGRYQVQCSAAGFAPQERHEMRLEVGQTARVDFELSVGTVAESIEVSAAASLLQSETTDVGQVIDNKRILEMPLNGRNYLELARLTAGVLPASRNNSATEGNFVAVGMHAYQNNVLLDGNDNSARASGGPMGFQAQAVKPPIDAVAEFKVVTNNTSAEHGFRMGAKVLVTTKSGTNQYHGSAYEFLRNDKFDGSNFFANRVGAQKPTYRQNQFGGTFGGPVVKNRTFFFGSYQGTRIRLGRSYVSTVPSRETVSGDFSKQPATRRNIFDPLTLAGSGATVTRQPFAGNRIPVSRFDPVAKTVADLYPAPNIAGREFLPNNYYLAPSDADDANQYDFRGDHNLTDMHRVFIRYSIRDQRRDTPGRLPLPADGGTGEFLTADAHNVAANLGSTLGATRHNELRFGWSHFPAVFDIPYTENLNKKFGIRNAPGDSFNDGLDHGFARFTPADFTELGPKSNWPNRNVADNLLIADTMMIQRGRHGIKFGGEFRRLNYFREAQRFRRGFFQFSGVYTSDQPNNATSRANTGNGLADMLLGWASSNQYGNQQGNNNINPYYGAFIQDDWKLSTSLTLNIGLRWDFFQAPYFPNPEKQSVVRYLTNDKNGVPLDKEGFVFPKDGRDSGAIDNFRNFAPRLGLAYRLTSQTVIRAGAGIYFAETDGIDWESTRFQTGPPRALEFSSPQPRETTELYVQRGFPNFTPGVIPPGTVLQRVISMPDYLPTPYSAQWFFDIQQTLPLDTLLTVGYQGNVSKHLNATELNINAPYTPHPTIRWQDRRIRPQFETVLTNDNMLSASYQALMVKGEKRFSRGLTFLSSFTWSHNIDYKTPFLESGSGYATPRDLSRERANSTLDRRLAYAFSFLYELPFGRGRKWSQSGLSSLITGGWQVGGLLSLLSGMAEDHSFNIDNQNTGGRVRGDWVRSPNLPNSERTIDRWFDTGFVRASAPGVISNAGRNLIYGAGRKNFDLIVARSFGMPWEGHSLQFRFESFNLTNTPNFGSPNVAVGTPAAGAINSADEPRRIQFGLKYLF